MRVDAEVREGTGEIFSLILPYALAAIFPATGGADAHLLQQQKVKARD